MLRRFLADHPASRLPFYDETGVQDTAEYRQAPWGLDVTDYASELTPVGEQLVIPGCERNRARTKGQLDLFG